MYDNYYAPEQIRIENKSIAIYQLYHWMKTGFVKPRTEPQKSRIWNCQNQSLLIESILLNIPISIFYFNEDADGSMTIIDGMQRLTAIFQFMNNKLRLLNLQYLYEYQGYLYEELPKRYQRKIDETPLSINILDSRCSSAVKMDILRRINTIGTPLKNQQIRMLMANDKTKDLLSDMISSKDFEIHTSLDFSMHKADRQEFCIYYLAFKFNKECTAPLTTPALMLDKTILLLNELPISELDYLYDSFITGLKRCNALFEGELWRRTKRMNYKFLAVSACICLSEYEQSLSWFKSHQKNGIRFLESLYEEKTEPYPKYKVNYIIQYYIRRINNFLRELEYEN